MNAIFYRSNTLYTCKRAFEDRELYSRFNAIRSITNTNAFNGYEALQALTQNLNPNSNESIWTQNLLSYGAATGNVDFSQLAFDNSTPFEYSFVDALFNIPNSNTVSNTTSTRRTEIQAETARTVSNPFSTSIPAALESVYNKELSTELAKTAEKTAKRLNSFNWCAKGVNDTLEAAGFVEKNSTRVPSAYMLDSKYGNCSSLKEVKVSRSELKNLPAGCIIVWQGKNTKDGSFGQHGHVCVTLGNGKEASDHVSEFKIRSTDFKVYVPVSKVA
ncbi:hypothetical protein IJV79_03990 [bacterium]|nr:hypothetical protein [bacterium]